MMQKLLLKNWQNHEEKAIEFDPYVTTFVGPSDAGKSAIIRALCFLAFNRPSGSSFITEGKEVTSVGLLIDNHKIIRTKGKGVNVYKLDGKVYKAFGNEIPEEIKQILNLEKEVNFQFQLEPHFWFLDSPGQVSKNLNQIVNLSSIDNALSKVGLEVRRAKTVYELTEQRCAEAQAKVDELSWTTKFSQDLTALEEKNKRIVSIRNSRSAVEAKLVCVKSLRQRLDHLTGDVVAMQKLEEIGLRARRVYQKRVHIENLLEDIYRAREFVERQLPDLSKVLAIRKRGDEISERRGVLEGLIHSIKMKRERLCLVQQQIADLEERLQSFVGKACPTCGNILTSSLCSHQIGTSNLSRRLAAQKKKIGERHRKDT